MLLCEVILGASNLEEARGQTENAPVRFQIPCGLEALQNDLEKLEDVRRERGIWTSMLAACLAYCYCHHYRQMDECFLGFFFGTCSSFFYSCFFQGSLTEQVAGTEILVLSMPVPSPRAKTIIVSSYRMIPCHRDVSVHVSTAKRPLWKLSNEA